MSLSSLRDFLCCCTITGGLRPRLWSLVPSGLLASPLKLIIVRKPMDSHINRGTHNFPRTAIYKIVPESTSFHRARILYIMCMIVSCEFFQIKGAKVLPVSGKSVPLHPQTRPDRPLGMGRAVMRSIGACSLRDLHRQKL